MDMVLAVGLSHGVSAEAAAAEPTTIAAAAMSPTVMVRMTNIARTPVLVALSGILILGAVRICRP